MEVRRSGEKICQAQCGRIQERFSNLEKNGAVSDRFGLRMRVVWGKMVLTTYINVFLAVLFRLVVHPTSPLKPKLENLAVRPTLPPKQSSRCLHTQPAVPVGLKPHRKKRVSTHLRVTTFRRTYLSDCVQGRVLSSVVVRKVTSRTLDSRTLKATFQRTMRPRRGIAITSGTSSTPAGGSVSPGNSMMVTSHPRIASVRWRDLGVSHLANRN